MDGSGDNLLIQLGSQIIEYANKKSTINKNIIRENQEYADIMAGYNSLEEINAEIEAQIAALLRDHNDKIASYNNELQLLDTTYPYIADIDGTTPESRLVVYGLDYAGNGVVIGDLDSEALSTRLLARSYNISLAPLNGIVTAP